MAVVINGTTGIDKVQDDSVDIADLSATGSPSSSTYLRGDNTWATVSAGVETNLTATSNIGLGANAVDSITTGDYNVGIGDDAMTATTEGGYNVAVGHEAMKANTTGGNNVSIGDSSMEANTTGNNNVAVGRGAFTVNTTGSANTAVGKASLDANTTANHNTALGYIALGANSTGTQNTALGSEALQDNTTADNNTAVGYNALKANTTAEYNTAVGSESMLTNTTGQKNTAVGRNTLGSNTTGFQNTSVGRNAGYGNTTAAYNTAIGDEALYSNATGNTNTCIGYRAGRSIAGDGGAGGVDNVCIGAGAGYDTNAITGGRWNIIIGNWARGQGGNYEAETVIGYNVGGGAENRFTFGINTNDTACSFGSTSWSAPSDERYKKDIVTSTAGLSFVNDLRPVTHKWKNEGDLPSDHNAYVEGSTNVYNNATKTYHGFVAQEVKTAIDAHSEIKDGFDLWDVDGDGRQRIADGALMPILVKAIQELSAKNTALEARITTLEG